MYSVLCMPFPLISTLRLIKLNIQLYVFILSAQTYLSGLYDIESNEEASSKVQSNEALKLYSVLWVSEFASTFGDSPRRLAPNSSLTKEFKESPFEPRCELKRERR